ncbi:synaptotagmin-like protein 2 isoform X3 [Carcharodon carcharias]|uniref:synaptotagmin-like protein 2 isoform X3 n=1 Tax=Carcharodon carcharias TaxID=13397 RepID=UPI001B7F2ECD|nr:synaptotagmin-like protein 2 isoform X3 [Carcharodon carcharias]XP_041054919.1 synaptotagmin-like protein 2 isoform X3 [Carcharodon carcharias]XP_041054920.1 synaptotagmin-like protein 2 isoform X3 [Carcharodon carcharias]XP_041054921.1 synaptotagmin-like protein 2 isoform X3 [Carcharodon carcharias]XP_041054922.1 synaptotagmin-like protein 2 isoform X3 [Carcharodon carcharias]
MIDLSHLTEEEQATIMRVLQRDADLRKVEEKRVRYLQETSVENEIQRKNMTGEWFYKAKAKRHKDTLHGAELIQASMQKKKPMTIYERLQSKELKEKSKIRMSNAERAIFIPPELSVFLEEPKLEEPKTSTTSDKNNRAPQQQQTPRQNMLSPGKQRENPFNKSFLEDDIPNGGERPQLSAGTESTSMTPVAERLSQPKDNVSRLHSPSNEFHETTKPSPAEDNNHSARHPVPKLRTNSYKLQDSVTYGDQLHTAPGHTNWNSFSGNSTTPKSILKRSPSSSSNDSEILHISVQDSRIKIPASPQTIPEGPTEMNTAVESEELLIPNSLERSKQVRFSTNVDEKMILQSLEPYSANKTSKIGEDSLLDTDYLEETDEENGGRTDSTEENGGRTDSTEENGGRTDSTEENGGRTDSTEENGGRTDSTEENGGRTDSTEENGGRTDSTEENGGRTDSAEENGGRTDSAEENGGRTDSAEENGGRTDSAEENGSRTDSAEENGSRTDSAEENGGRMDSAEENENQHKANGFSDLHNLSSLQTEPLYLNQADDVMSNSDFQSKPATNYTNSHLASYGSGKPTNQVHEMGTGEILMENEANRRLNPASNLSFHNVDKWILHTDFESPQVSNQQPTKISEGEEEEMFPLVLRRNSHTNETYKSLEDINGVSSMPSTLDSTNKEMILSAQNVSTIPASPENTLLQSKRMKRLSKSVPAFPENDDADSVLESSFQMDRHGTNTSSLTNISNSSGMASRSSVSGSTMSVYSGDFGNIDVRGKIQFSLDYVDKLKEFHIFVVRCSDLAAAEEKKNRSDPYVKSYLLPDKIKMGKRKTSVKKKSLNPVYNEVLRYKIEKATLMAQTLNLSVWHNDTFGRNSFLGEVEVELKKWDWSNKKMDWHKLKPRTLSVNRMDDRGSLKVAFRYIPQGQGGKKTGEVQIWVKEASNLPQIRPNRLDPFVKCFILPDTSRKSRQKTRVVKKNRNPVFNHTMVYDGFRTEDLKDACVELSVWDHDKLLNHFLGGLRIGLGTGKSYGQAVDWMDSTEEEVSVWDKMITHPNTWIEDVLPLRMLMLSKMSGN